MFIGYNQPIIHLKWWEESPKNWELAEWERDGYSRLASSQSLHNFFLVILLRKIDD